MPIIDYIKRLLTPRQDTIYNVITRDGRKFSSTNKQVSRQAALRYINSYNGVINGAQRVRNNTSKTSKESSKFENRVHLGINGEKQSKNYNKNYDIPYTGKGVIVNGVFHDIAGLDSVAKYAGIHNRNPKLPQYERKLRGANRVSLAEAVGLPSQETMGGAVPYYNTGDKDKPVDDRTLLNSNYLRAYGSIPAANYIRDFRYISDVNPHLYPDSDKMITNTPPLLHAMQYYANGNYNPGNKNHNKNVQSRGNIVINALKKAGLYDEVNDFYTGRRTKAYGGPIIHLEEL